MPVALDFEQACTSEQAGHGDGAPVGVKGFQCATARGVPLDYRHPGGRTIHLTLFFNPGGPGAAGSVFLPSVYHDFPAEFAVPRRWAGSVARCRITASATRRRRA